MNEKMSPPTTTISHTRKQKQQQQQSGVNDDNDDDHHYHQEKYEEDHIHRHDRHINPSESSNEDEGGRTSSNDNNNEIYNYDYHNEHHQQEQQQQQQHNHQYDNDDGVVEEINDETNNSYGEPINDYHDQSGFIGDDNKNNKESLPTGTNDKNDIDNNNDTDKTNDKNNDNDAPLHQQHHHHGGSHHEYDEEEEIQYDEGNGKLKVGEGMQELYQDREEDQNHEERQNENGNNNDIDNDAEDNDAENEWNDVLQDIMENENPETSKTYHNATQFQDGCYRIQCVNDRLQLTFEECAQDGLDDIVKNMLHNTIIPIYQQWHDEIQNKERNIINTFVSNHQRRITIQTQLDHCNEQWNNKYETLRQMTLDRKNKSKMDSDAGINDNDANNVNNYEGTAVVANNNNNNEGDDNVGEVVGHNNDAVNDDDHDRGDDDIVEPNWDELMTGGDDITRENIQSFLQAREQWHAALDTFRTILNDTNDDIQNCIENIQKIIIDAHETIMTPMNEQQNAIRNAIITNYQRKRFLEHALYEVAKQQQDMITKLMANVLNVKQQQQQNNVYPGTLSSVAPAMFPGSKQPQRPQPIPQQAKHRSQQQQHQRQFPPVISIHQTQQQNSHQPPRQQQQQRQLDSNMNDKYKSSRNKQLPHQQLVQAKTSRQDVGSSSGAQKKSKKRSKCMSHVDGPNIKK